MKTEEEKKEITFEYYIKVKLDDLEMEDWSKEKWKKLKDGYLEGKCSWEDWQRYVTGKEEETRRLPGDEEFEGQTGQEIMKKCYDNIVEVLDYYMDLPDDTKNAVALWIIGTYFHSNFSTFPYLFVNAMRGSGKTRLLKIIAALSCEGQLTASLTEAVMFRTTGTLALDEFEGLNSKDNASLRELLNASYKKGTKIMRMTKKRGPDGENLQVEEFEPYRPLVMANIFGMTEVLGDRCVTILLEKSSALHIIKLVEDFENLTYTTYTRKALEYLKRCRLCRIITKKDIKEKWNDYIKSRYTQTTLTTNTYTTYTTYTKLFDQIDVTEIEGRSLELFLPLFLVAAEVSSVCLENIIHYAKKVVNEKKIEEMTESRDVLIYSMVSKERERDWKDVKDLTTIFKLMIGDDSDWINNAWMGRALKRLNLVKEKRRMNKGIQVILDVKKAKQKEIIFQPKEKEEEVKEDGRKPEEDIPKIIKTSN